MAVLAHSAPVLIPLRGSDQSVHVDPDSLPADVYDIIEVLRSEVAQREVWTRVARAFDAACRLADCIRILEDALRPEMERILSSSEKDGMGKVELLVTLGSAYVIRAQDEAIDEDEKADLLDHAGRAFNQAENIFVQSPTVWEAKAWREMFANNLDRARSCFETAVNIGKSTVAGSLGMAALYLNSNDMGNAAKHFRSTMRIMRCPASSWLGLGHALYANGSLRPAKDAFQRAMDSAQGKSSYAVDAVEALISLATIHANDGTRNGAQEAFGLLLQAFLVQKDAHRPFDPRLLCHIAELLFYSGDVDRAAEFANRAVQLVTTNTPPGVKADAHLQLARIAHARGEFRDADQQYAQALHILSAAKVTHRPPLLHLGRGLLLLASGDRDRIKEAVDHLQRVLKSNDKCTVARRALGVAFARNVLRTGEVEEDEAVAESRREQALTLLKRGLAEEGGDQDVPALLSYAQLVELHTPAEAIGAYQKALAALVADRKPEPLEVLNNLAALQARNQDYSGARETLERAMSNTRAEEGLSPEEDLGPKFVTLTYNCARLYELEGDLRKAESIYRRMTELYEDYTDAHIRLGHLLKLQGSFSAAEECAKRAMTSNSASAKTFGTSFLASIYRQKKDYGALQRLLERASEQHLDKYADVALAAFWNDNMTSVEPARRQRMLERIQRGFSKVLRDSPSNALAAAGIGCFLAANGQMTDARDVFAATVGHRLSGDMIRIDLAHVQVEIAKSHHAARANGRLSGAPGGSGGSGGGSGGANLGNHRDTSYFDQASKLYDDAIAKTPQGKSNLEMLLYSARALFEAGNYKEAQQVLQRLLHLGPQYLSLWYNFGLNLQECALERMEKHSKVVTQVKLATTELDRAHRLFTRLRTCSPYEGSGPTRAKPSGQNANNHYRYCKDRLNKARVVLVNAEQEEKNAQDRMEQQQREIEEQEAKKEQERLDALRREEDLQRELEARQKELDEKVKLDLLRSEQEAEESDAREEDDEEPAQPLEPTGGSPVQIRKRKASATDSDEGTESRKSSKKLRKPQLSDSESGGDAFGIGGGDDSMDEEDDNVRQVFG